MKQPADLVRGWLLKANSDQLAMIGAASAGAADAACFHAQQASEKLLKALLAAHGVAIPVTHNLVKLLSMCSGVCPTLGGLEPAAQALTPYAVHARYDLEFWPDQAALTEAEAYVDQLRLLVAAGLPADAPRRLLNCSGRHYLEWRSARARFDWQVDLRLYSEAAKFPGYFDRIVSPAELPDFEARFRSALGSRASILATAEVAFWKNFGNHKSRNRITSDLIEWLSSPGGVNRLREALVEVAEKMDWKAFRALQAASGHVAGFATPLAYLSFFDPGRFPMADRRTAEWWGASFPSKAQFSRRSDGWVEPRMASWDAYVDWTRFCCEQAVRLSAFGTAWRARDVEMAVWSDRDHQLPMPTSP